jgi:thiol-disulfide isomerase/thioredoxin
MKRLFPFLLVIGFSIRTSAQRNNIQPLVIQGKLTNAPEKNLLISFTDDNGLTVLDTITLNDAGEFYLKTYKITRPQRTSIQQKATQINDIYVAPGYDLRITGDAADYIHLYATKQITGTGAEVNRYRVLMDSIAVTRNDRTRWFDLKLEDLLPYLKKTKSLDDSVFQVVFSQPAKQDPYFDTFKKMVDIDNQSILFYMLLEHIDMNQYSETQMTALVNENTPAIFSKGISNDDYLLSSDYTTWLLPAYFNYAKRIDKIRDSALVKQPGYTLQKINQLFTGKVKDNFLYGSIEPKIRLANSLEQLDKAQKGFQTRFDAITNPALKEDLTHILAEKQAQLLLVQIGKPAPDFGLQDDKGNLHTLSDFKGKVIYIDLWASWCAPCRAEIPDYKTLSNKYKGNEQVAFMSIDVHDGEKQWRKALSEENPNWLQLYDKDGVVARLYAATLIPKYILIDKAGKMVSFNAPTPGEADAERLIKQEIAR